MNHTFSEGFPFEIGDVWRQSSFQSDDHQDGLFKSFDVDLPPLDIQKDHGLFYADLDIPELEYSSDITHEQLESTNSKTSSSFDTAHEAAEVADVWSLDTTLNGSSPSSCLRTWEAFDKKAVSNSQCIPLLSEADQAVFDVAIQRIEQRPVESGVLPQDVLLRSLYHLVLGRSSLFFRWDASKGSFARTLEGVPSSGYSAASSDKLTQLIVEVGTSFRNLSEYGRSLPAQKHTCTATIALKGAVVKTLDSIEKHITSSITRIRSLPQLSSMLNRPHQLLKIFETLKNAVHGLSSDEAVISVISNKVNEFVVTQTHFADTLQALLARVSAPWLERLCVELHLTEATIHCIPLEDAKENAELSAAAVEHDGHKFPDFVDTNDHALILECKQSLAALRRQLPDHQVSIAPSIGLKSLLLDNGDTRALMTGFERTVEPDEQTCLSRSSADVRDEGIEALDERMSQPLPSAEDGMDDLQAKVDTALIMDLNPSNTSSRLGRTEYNPIEKLRPLIQAHAKMINTTVLQHVFWTCRLRDHLDLQRQFHLFGNGDFVARLSTALFSNETQSAERRKGNVPTGEVMGLRLGTRDEQRWPPASSELRLTLAGILTETHYSYRRTAAVKGAHSKELPGGLSFSIRELPDDEIERVLDSGSIHALDFLRLQYVTPPGLEAIITTPTLEWYDAIFRQLLRMLRMLDTTVKLVDRARSRRARAHAYPAFIARFASEAHHFVSTVMSHLLDLGIDSPWQAFLASIGQVEMALKDPKESNDNGIMIGLDGLRQLHEQCLENIRSRTFLRQRHRKVLTGIDDVFTAILQCSAALEKDDLDSLTVLITNFGGTVKGLLMTLRTIMNRPGKVKTDTATSDDDAEAASILLARLNWNGYYKEVT